MIDVTGGTKYRGLGGGGNGTVVIAASASLHLLTSFNECNSKLFVEDYK